MTQHQSMGHKGAVIKAQVHWDQKGPNAIITLMCTLTANLPKLAVMSYGHNGHYLTDVWYISVQSTKMLMSGQNPHFFEDEAQPCCKTE